VFSTRLTWDQATNPLTLALLHRPPTAPPILDLTVGNPTQALPQIYDAPLREALGALADPAGLRYEPTPRGLLDCRRAIADYYARRGIAIDPEHLVLCASTSEAYSWLFQLLCDPGDAVLFPQPSYPLIDFLARLSAVQVLTYPLRFCLDQFVLDAAGLAAIATESATGGRPRALIAISPNNPTGSVLRRSDLSLLRRHCAAGELALIVDEVFSDYLLSSPSPADGTPEENPLIPSVLGEPAAEAQPLTFVLSGLSKVLGLPQLKLGWIHVSGPEPLRSQAQDRLELIADTFLSVNTPVQLASVGLLREQNRIAAALTSHVAANLRRLAAILTGSAISPLPVEAGWYAILRLPAIRSEDEWTVSLLQDDDVLVHPGYFFDLLEPGKAFVVISLLAPADVFQRGIARLRDRVAQVLQPG
jgi:alanine-synthesizing transaminase